jgi:hypothetical protein
MGATQHVIQMRLIDRIPSPGGALLASNDNRTTSSATATVLVRSRPPAYHHR